MKSPAAREEVAPPHLRCHRRDGRKWQCHRYVFGSFTVCEHHYRLRCKKKRSPLKALIRRKEVAPATEPLHDRQTRPAPSTKLPHDQQTTKPPPDGRELMRRNASSPAAPAVPAIPAATADTHDQRTFELRSRKVIVEPPPQSATESPPDRQTGEMRSRGMAAEPPDDRQTSESKRRRDTTPSTPDQRTMQLGPRKVATPSKKPPPVQPLKKRLQRGEEAEATPAAAVTMVTSFLPNGVKVVTPVLSDNAGPVVARPSGFDNAAKEISSSGGAGRNLRSCFRWRNLRGLSLPHWFSCDNEEFS